MPLPWSLSSLAIPAVLALIAFLAGSSQPLLAQLEPGPPSQQESRLFNAVVAAMLVCYARACLTDPGRVSKDWRESGSSASKSPRRWCRKCEGYKPPRSHHCRHCMRDIPKMDHHCPWTANCVSHRTQPHFLRFLFYAVVAMLALERMLLARVSALWQDRHLAAALGPPGRQLVHLFLLLAVNSLTVLALAILLARSLYALAVNTTTIESWEIDRHRVLLRRARVLGGYLPGPDGARVLVRRQEFPYDVGIWRNIRQGMGTMNILAWFWPFAASLPISSGLDFETNGLDDPTSSWPPPDPDRIPRLVYTKGNHPFTYPDEHGSTAEQIDAFRRRQNQDLHQRQHFQSQQPGDKRQELLLRQRPFHERLATSHRSTPKEGQASSTSITHPAQIDATVNGHIDTSHGDGDGDTARSMIDGATEAGSGSGSGEEGWRNGEGERLADFGLDEEVEFYDEDDRSMAQASR